MGSFYTVQLSNTRDRRKSSGMESTHKFSGTHSQPQLTFILTTFKKGLRPHSHSAKTISQLVQLYPTMGLHFNYPNVGELSQHLPA